MTSSRNETTELTLNDGSTIRLLDFGDFFLLRGTADLDGQIARLGRAIFQRGFNFIDEVIVTEVEICLLLNDQYEPNLLGQIGELELSDSAGIKSKKHELGIWFSDDFDDWSLISRHTGLTKDQYIEQLLQCKFTVAMLGFLPGFVYLNGLPDELHVPRKSSPATRTSPNTFAIGGKYGGIYALSSAAGWNCVGRIGETILDVDQLPPLTVSQGDSVSLKRVDESEYSLVTTRCKDDSRHAEHQPSFRIEKPGTLTLIQDSGRVGLAFYAIPRGGPLDLSAANLANSVLCNAVDAAVIECHFVPPEITFEADATLCLTGANMNWCIDGTKVKRHRTIEIQAGSRLTGSPANDGCRGYIGIRGSIKTQTTFGSASCYMPGKFGGNHGEPLKRGDFVRWAEPDTPMFPVRLDLTTGSLDKPLRFIPGPEFDWLNAKSKRLISSSSFAIERNSDRMGARLDGPKLSTGERQMSDSVPLLPGMIQLTPHGQCIVVLQDGQTTGGYPRIGYLDSANVERLNQIPIGRSFSFEL